MISTMRNWKTKGKQAKHSLAQIMRNYEQNAQLQGYSQHQSGILSDLPSEIFWQFPRKGNLKVLEESPGKSKL